MLFSKSGNTEELLKLVPCAKAKGAYLIAVTSVESNALAGVCDMNVHLPLERELCPFDLAPVTSTAIQMVFGDTVAIALMSARNLTREEYATNHPAGRIGKSLIFKVFFFSCQFRLFPTKIVNFICYVAKCRFGVFVIPCFFHVNYDEIISFLCFSSNSVFKFFDVRPEFATVFLLFFLLTKRNEIIYFDECSL